ncbi:MAG: thymidine kinase [bacterium]
MYINNGRHSGWIEVICGPMFSGKTEELIRRLRLAQIAKQRIEIFKPALDTRYSEEHIESHDEQRFKCTPVPAASKILEALGDHTRVVGVDEAQFFDASIVTVCQRLANRGIRVIVAGLDQDYIGNPFGPMPSLMAVAESVLKLKAVCMVCGGLASRSQRLTRETSQVVLGAADHYEARCRACFDPDLGSQSTEPLFNSARRNEERE